MQKSPLKVVELCVYALIIIFAVIWLFTGGRFYKPPLQTFTVTPSTGHEMSSEPPPAMVPRGEMFP